MAPLLYNYQTQQAPCLIQLKSLGVIEVTGPDAQSFLQGQFTCDLQHLSWQNWQAGGYCDAKGKLWATFRLVGDKERILIFLARESLAATLNQLKKFAVFSKVTLTEIDTQMNPEQALYALWGLDAAGTFAFEPTNTVNYRQTAAGEQIALQLSEHLVLIYGSYQASDQPLYPESWWHAAQFELGWVDVPASLAAEYIPQMLNLDRHQGISYKKGCYLGQEIVARMHYKGQNKRITHRFIGSSSQLPQPGDVVEINVAENWRRAGAVLSVVRYDDGVVAFYAVGPTDLEPASQFRIQGQNDSQFTLCPPQPKMEP